LKGRALLFLGGCFCELGLILLRFKLFGQVKPLFYIPEAVGLGVWVGWGVFLQGCSHFSLLFGEGNIGVAEYFSGCRRRWSRILLNLLFG
ncbi:hypothetical protein, partial [Salmonella enterica]|uniref:hypothetical protein n=1 Tax=Salmonella enterica TaxID=28901 RepID=UPI00398C6A9F